MSKSKFIEFAGYAPDRVHEGPQYMALAHNFIPTIRGLETLRTVREVPQPIGVFAPHFNDKLYSVASEYGANFETGVHVKYAVTAPNNVTVRVKRQLFDVGVAWYEVDTALVAVDAINFRAPVRFGEHVLYKVPLRYLRAVNTSTSSTAPADIITAAPTYASRIVVAQRFVLLFGGNVSNTPHDWWFCSARDDHTSWTLNPATLCARGRLTDDAGGIIDAIEYNNNVLVVKPRSMYIGRFVPGDAEVWTWERLPFDINLPAIPGVVLARTRHGIAILERDRVSLYDGAQVLPLFTRRECTPDPSTSQAFSIQFPANNGQLAYYDIDDVLLVFAPAQSTSTVYVAYNFDTRKVTTGTLNVRATGVSVHRGFVLGLPPHAASGTASTVSVLAIDNPGDPLSTATYGPATSNPVIETGDIGDEFADTEITETRIQNWRPGTTVQCVPKYRDGLSSAFSTAATSVAIDGRHELRQIAKWHRLRYIFPVPPENTASVDVPWVLRGMRVVMENVGETGED